MELTRREALKIVLGGGAVLYVSPWSLTSVVGSAYASDSILGKISPIDRSLPLKAPAQFFADDPTNAHQVLWNKSGYLESNKLSIPTPKEKVPLVVIGGGISGLVSAYLLRDKKPVLLEQDKRFGGNSKGQSWQGIDYSIGAAYFVEPEPDSDIGKLIHELGIDSHWKIKTDEDPVSVNGSIYTGFWEGESLKHDERGTRQMEKLSAYFKKVNEGEEISYPDIPITDPALLPYIQKLDQVSFKAHLESVLGEPMHPQIETAIEHYCWSSLCASASEVSAAAGLNFYAAEFGNIALLPGGNAKVSETIVEKLYQALPENHLRANSLVFDVEVGTDGVRVAYLDGEGKVQSILAQCVVMACPKFVAKKLINDLEPERIAAIDQLRYRSYLVANVCLNGSVKDPFYDLYLLGNGELQGEDARSASQKQKVTDVIVANYASRKPGSKHTVLTLYRGLPYDGARAELYAPDAYQTYKQQFEQQVTESILPMLKISKDQVADLRIARWGHPLIVPKPGQITSSTVDIIRKPFRDRVFFVEQDNWMLPAFETSVTEALLFAPKIRAALQG